MVERISADEYEKLTEQERTQYDASLKKKQEEEQSRLPYKWKQTLDSVEINLFLPKETRGKDLNISILRSKIKVAFKNKPSEINGLLFNGPTSSIENNIVVDDQLFADIHVDDSTWMIDGTDLMIHLEKVNSQQWWPHVVKSDPLIDTSAIQPENSRLDQLDAGTRGMVEKMMFDQRQKSMGKPTSDEIKKEEAIKKFKELHPEMDFSGAEIM